MERAEEIELMKQSINQRQYDPIVFSKEEDPHEITFRKNNKSPSLSPDQSQKKKGGDVTDKAKNKGKQGGISMKA